jgi:DNA-binding transcriptional MocR family regulator
VSLTLEEMLAGDVADERAVLWVTSPARNPDGRTLVSAEVSRLDELAGACKRVVVNQAYHWAAPGAPRPQRALLLGSLHKLTGGGAAIGWRVGPDDPGPQRPSLGGPPRPWQSALAEFVDRGGLTELAAHGLTAACQRCRRFAEALTAFPCARLGYGDGPSIVLTVPSSLPQDAVVAEFAAADLAVGTGSSFGCPPTSVRLSFTGVNDADLQTCIQRTRQVLTRLLNRLDAAADCLLPIRDLGEWHARH